MEPSTIATIMAAIVGGGFATEVYRSWRNRKRVDLDLFYPTWKEEMRRLHTELALLRADVIALSAEVHRLGGDPLAIRYGEPNHFGEPSPDRKDDSV